MMSLSRAAIDRLFLLILAAVFLLPCSINADDMLFFDDFKNGTADNWDLIDIGYFSVSDEALCLETLCEP
jgi:hypothetical protein